MKQVTSAFLGFFGIGNRVQPVVWPPLPKEAFVAGRSATTEDVQADRAVFVLASDGQSIGEPISIQIPQYAWHCEGKKRTPVVVIQAEKANDQCVVGAVQPNGKHLAALLEEFEMLGVNAPDSQQIPQA